MKKQCALSLLFFMLLFVSWNYSSEDQQLIRLRSKAKEAAAFCRTNGFNSGFCILIDMSIHSGKKRAFYWDLKKDSLLASALCAHGCGSNSWSGTDTREKPVFSNIPDSHCTSLGKYKIGKRGYSFWGIKVNYLLHGLETTNNNALKREIVLHSWEDVSETEIYPQGTPEGWGCPAVANGFMKIIDPQLKQSEKPVLLWIFN